LGFAEKLRGEFSFFTGNYMVLIVSWILMDFAQELPGTYFSDYVLELGGSPTVLGLITAVSMLALASVQFPGGYFADKYGRRWLVSTLTFGVALSFIFHAVAPVWHYVLLGELLRNLCLLYQPALNAMFADSLPAKKRGMGFSILNLIMSVSTTPAPIAALFLVSTYGAITGMRIAYVIVIALFLAAAAVRLKLKESMQNAESFNLREVLSSFPESVREGIKVWEKVPRSMFFLFVSSAIVRFAFTMVMPLLLVYAFYVLQIGGPPNPAVLPALDPALQLARERWGYANIVLFSSMIVLSVPVGRLIDRLGRKIPLILSGVLAVPATVLFVYGDYETLFVALVLWGASQLLGYSASQALFADLVPQSERGKATGSMNFFTYLLMAVGGIAGGLMYDNVSPQLPFLLMLILTIPSLILTIYGIQEPKPEEREN
jgi:MFS family permease